MDERDRQPDGTLAREHGRIARRPSAAPAGADARRRERQDALLDEAIEETFPASDPVSVARLW